MPSKHTEAEDRDRAQFIALRIMQAVKKPGVRDPMAVAKHAANLACVEWDRRDIREKRQRRRTENLDSARPEPASHAMPPDVQVAIADLAEWLLRRLSPEQRDVIVMRHLEQRPVAEVAAKLGIAKRAVRARAEKAMRQLREQRT